MQQDFNHGQAMEMLNSTLREMKGELNEVDDMSLRGPKKKMAKHMHEIYDELNELVDKFSESQNHEDFNYVCRQIEILQPAFVLNYNEILE